MAVKLFKNRSAELGEPNKSLLFAKLASPPFCGARRKMIKIKNPLNSNQSIFNIEQYKVLIKIIFMHEITKANKIINLLRFQRLL